MALFVPGFDDVAAVTGVTAARRGSQLIDAVHGPERHGARLRAWVRGSRPQPYQVVLDLTTDGVSRAHCTCPIGGVGRCKHVAALLLLWSGDEGGWPDLAAHGEEDWPDDMVRWVVEHGGHKLLRWPVSKLVGVTRWDRAATRNTTVEDALRDPRLEAWMRERLWRELEDRITRQGAVLRFEEARRPHREAVPAEALRGLWARLLELRQQLRSRATPGLRGEADYPMVQLQSDPPELVVPVDHVAVRIPMTGPLEVEDDAERWLDAIDVALDCVIQAPGELQRQAVSILETPPWKRALDQLDRVLECTATDLEEPDAQRRAFGWSVTQRLGHWSLEPVRVRRYKTRPGFRTWKAAMSELPTAMDRRAGAVLAEHVYTYGDRDIVRQSRTVRALEELVGHPRVFVYRQDGHVRVEVGQGGVVLALGDGEEGGVQVRLLVEGEPLSERQLERLVASAAAERGLHLDLSRHVLWIVALGESRLALIRHFVQRGWTWPDIARPMLLDRLDALGARIEVRLEGSMRGRDIVPERRPLIRLDPREDGSIEVTGWVVPIGGGPRLPIGTGPREVALVRDGVRLVAVRDLDDELEHFRALLGAHAPEGLPCYEVEDPDAGLELLAHLDSLGDRVDLEWCRAARRVTRPATARDLRVGGRARRDWFGLEGGLDVDGVVVPLDQLLAAIRDRQRAVRVDAQTWVRLSDELRAQLARVAAISWATIEGGVRTSPLGALTLETVEAAGARVELPDVETSVTRLREAETLQPVVPGALRAELRDYQREGFVWLMRLAHWAPGACLADDMGLGKTVQSLALLLARSGPALVVAPASVGVNWVREAARFAPSLRVRRYQGRQRRQLLAALEPMDVVVTSWQLLQRDIEALRAVRFTTAVLDEAQAIKNANTARSRAAVQLDAGFVVALSGTPVENRVGEIWALFRAVVPGLLGSAERFRDRFARPIESRGDLEARADLSRLISPFLLRRTKAMVASQLPSRSESVIHVDLGRDERRRYDEVRRSAVAALGDEDQRFAVLAALTRLRQLACHPRLVDPDAPARSAKLERLRGLVAELRQSGHRALVFSQFTAHLGLVRTALEADGVTLRVLDGSMTASARQREIDAFQSGHGEVFLISLRAGGTGLNLTAADYVIHLDPWWNPAVEDQATDRAHRIGQTRPVTVYRLVARDTIEEAVLALHQDKRSLVRDLLEGAARPTLGTAELLALIRGL